MEFVLFVAACLAFSLSPAHAPLALRCGLAACLRFSPRAAIALSAVAAFSGHLGALAGRGGLRAVPPAQRPPVACAAVVGGTLGRMALLLFVARFSGSLALAQLQAAALLVLCAAALLPGRVGRMRLPRSRAGLFASKAAPLWENFIFSRDIYRPGFSFARICGIISPSSGLCPDGRRAPGHLPRKCALMMAWDAYISLRRKAALAPNAATIERMIRHAT